MFKILIADDEKYIRRGICSILERNLEEVTCIEAKNGLEALEKAEQETLGLIITDISMPGMDGLEFVKELKNQQVNTTIIILSGYENFAYAKQAITLGIREYVMKPIKKAEFIELIKQYMDDIRKQQLKTREEIDQRMKNRHIIEGIKKEFLVGLLNCSDDLEASQYVRQLKELQLNLVPQLCTCVAFQYEINAENREYMDFVVKNILDEYLSLHSDEFLLNVTYDVGKDIAIFKAGSGSKGSDQRKKLIRDAARLVREYGKVRVFAGVGDVAPDFEHLSGVLKHALTALEHKIFESGDILCIYDQIKAGTHTKLPKIIKYDDVLELWNDLNRIYGKGQTQAVLDELKMRYHEAREFIRIQMLKHIGAVKQQEDICKEFSQCWTLDELKRELKNGLDQLESLKGTTDPINYQFMEQVIQFVDANITSDLDLNRIADQFRRTPGYISTMFKRYTQDGFNSYVTKKRMEIAKKLLKNPHIPIQEIAQSCGYDNAKYFSVVFKKNTGQSPRTYRIQNMLVFDRT